MNQRQRKISRKQEIQIIKQKRKKYVDTRKIHIYVVAK